ncbi:UDP-3-O-acylglucosamine N-acyltransferase [Pirellulimonas nuda]|uniref:UDP-3-O-acylglucosamine N-acyltransferase n=1 Tax=Pirellulimonas nuda TaxID=2528009 RepID=A0A518DGW2_9BACT|nr:UDP-3-O-(3-hydroxymyristoyl)glucosamine N-acyltransferase [Pirellulimonas nuda]QDU90714.1 UDP-3-O-acylglucosamine N-acyltransferase [Pirellulimonas nuda]
MSYADAAPIGELARLVSGDLIGDPTTPIQGAAVLSEAGAGQITFIDHADRLRTLSGVAAVVAPRDATGADCPMVLVDDVYAAFDLIIARFSKAARPKPKASIHRTAVIASTASLGADVCIGPNVSIGEEVVIGAGVTLHAGVVVMDGCRIGAGTTIFPNAVLYHDTVLGQRCIIHACASLGANGFGYRQHEGRHCLSAQLGSVQLGDEVEIGAGSTVDRGAYGATRIGDGTKIDNLVQIAHNCQIGRHNLICSQVGIAGSSNTGDYVVMGGQAGVRDHVTVGDNAVISAMSGVSNDVRAGETMLGAPATPVREQRLRLAAFAKLVEMRKDFKTLRSKIAEIEKQLAATAGQPSAATRVDRAA